MRAHGVCYQATMTPAYAEDMVRKFAKARGVRGFRFMHILSPCPPGWKYDPRLTISLSRLAVQTGLFPLYEIEAGRLKLNVNLPKRRPVGEFLRRQSRFKALSAQDEAVIQQEVDRRWEAFVAQAV